MSDLFARLSPIPHSIYESKNGRHRRVLSVENNLVTYATVPHTGRGVIGVSSLKAFCRWANLPTPRVQPKQDRLSRHARRPSAPSPTYNPTPTPAAWGMNLIRDALQEAPS